MEINDTSRAPIASEGLLLNLARSGNLDQQALTEALRFAGHRPNRVTWLGFIQNALIVLGAGFLVAGIFFFFAYNWDDLHRFAKLGLVQGAVLIAAGFAHFLKLDTLPGKISLTAASLLVGALVALFGQIYQSTADAYTLFLYWAIYILAWVIIGRFAPLWLVLVGLLNLALGLFWDQSTIDFSQRYEEESLFLLNSGALVGWEWYQRRGVAWMQGRWWPRMVSLVALIAITMPTVELILNVNQPYWQSPTPLWPALWAPILYVIFGMAGFFYYRYREIDVMVLTLLALSLISVLTAIISRLVNFDETIQLLVLSIVVVIQAGLAVIWLRNIEEEKS